MSRNIYIRERRKPKKKLNIKKLFFVSLLISFFALYFALWIMEGSYFTSTVGFVLGSKDYVVYNSYTLSFDDTIPQEYVNEVMSRLEQLEYDGIKRFEIQERNADIQISREKQDDSKEIFNKTLIPSAHIYSLVNNISKDTLPDYDIFVLDSSNEQFLKEDYDIQSTVLDSYSELVEKLSESDSNIGLVEFNDIDYQVKILEMDNEYYLENPSASIPISFYAKIKRNVDDFALSILSKYTGMGSNQWDESKLVKINMGGVVAMTRGLALKMDNLQDYAYPAREIGSFLADADLTHVSNEVSFVPDCQSYSGLRFCSRPEYIQTLQEAGVDIVELTGNHNNDFGSKYSVQTIEKYKSLGMRYYGGGLNSEDASEILYEDLKGSTIAFIGYNYYDSIYPSVALAAENRAGANFYSEEIMESDVKEARENADVVIVTFQFQECWSYPPTDVIYPICYKPLSNPDQKAVFRMAADFGADVVIGSQAHQPQTYELYGDSVIFYGTGNLFFDQNLWIGTRQGLIFSHYIYEGKLIQSKITPIYMGKDDLMPRLATQEQGDLLLRLLKEARE